MPDTPEQILARAQVPPTNGRPVRKDEIELDERGIYIESWLPERRSRRKPLLFVHGELAGSWVWERYLGYFAARGWEGHALNLRNHFWSQTADPRRSRSTPTPRTSSPRSSGSARTSSSSVTAWAACSRSRPPSGCRSPAWCCSARSCRATCGCLPAPHELREIPDVYGKSLIGWETLPERLLRDDRDLTLADVLRIQHLLGQKPHEAGAARRQILGGVPVDRRGLLETPRLVIGAGLDRGVTMAESERLAEWLDAGYEPFAAHSHYGLVVGENSFQQVAESIRGFLETNRL